MLRSAKQILPLLALIPGLAVPSFGQEPAAADEIFHKGICYAHSGGRGRGGGYGSPESAQTLAELKENNVNWISLTRFGNQRSPQDTYIRSMGGRFGENTDQGLAGDIQAAHDLGIRVMIKPHIWIGFNSWPGDIRFDNEADWDAWFASYTEMILGYAQLAERGGADYFCVGNELKGTSAAQPGRWRKLIAQIREQYSGPLIYAANWDEYRYIQWWDALDAIGINAYFPLSGETDPSLESLCDGAKTIRDQIAEVHQRFNKPVIFTELGYRSIAGAAAQPWEMGRGGEPDPELQARCYEAVFQTFWGVPWLEGIYWWKWFSNSSAVPTGQDRDPFSPRNKPAQDVMAKWFQKPYPRASARMRK